jgi:hypothetical protein
MRLRAPVRVSLTAALLAAVVVVGFPSPAAGGSGTTQQVTTTADVVDAGDGLVSLREAVSSITANGGGTVHLVADAEHVLTRCGGSDDTNAQGDLDADLNGGSIELEGHGATVRQTCPGERVLELFDGVGVELFDVTITGGDAGAADPNGGGVSADVSGSVELRDGTSVVGNQAAGSGGGVFGADGVDVSGRSTVSGNAAAIGGGGIAAAGDVFVTASTLEDNETEGTGGAIGAAGLVDLENTTVVGNRAEDAAGAVTAVGIVRTLYATIVDNHVLDAGGGASVESDDEVLLQASAVGFTSDPGDTTVCSTPADQSSWSRSTDHSCDLSGAGGNSSNVALGLSAPADHGGGLRTMEPLPGSTLRDVVPAGHTSFCEAYPDAFRDARSVPRPQGGACDVGAVETPLPFNDVGVAHPFFVEINEVLYHEITTGYPDGGFHPTDPVTRQAMAAFLFRLADVDVHVPGGQTFEDVSPTHPFFTEIDWLVSEEITTGYDDDTFRPAGLVTRQAIAAFLYRLVQADELGPTTPSFSDVGTGHPFYDEVEWLLEEELTTGYVDGTFRPSNTMTRQAMAAFLARTLEANLLM